MGNFWNDVGKFISQLDTKEARKSVASDLKKASAALFGLLLVNLPGKQASVLAALAKGLGFESAPFLVSVGVLWLVGGGAVLLRVLAFLLECEYSGEVPPAKKSKSKHKANN